MSTDRAAARRVLVVAFGFPPSSSPAAIPVAQLAKYLPGLGWHPTFLTVRPEAMRMRHTPATAPDLPQEDISVHRTAVAYPWEQIVRLARRVRPREPDRPQADLWWPEEDRAAPRRRSLQRRLTSALHDLLTFPDGQCGWLPFGVLGGLQVVRRCPVDCLYSVGPPMTAHLIGLGLHGALGLPWIADFHDPWLANPWREVRRWPLRQVEMRLQRSVLRGATRLVAKTPEMARVLAADAGRDLNRVATIPCTYDASEVEVARAGALRSSDRFVISHVGRFYGLRSPMPLLRALAPALASRAGSSPRVEFRLVAEFDPQVEVLAQRLGLAGVVRQVGLCSHLDAIRHIAGSDVAVVVQPGTDLQVPSKLCEYLGCGVPVLALTNEGATARIMHEARGGLVVAPDDVEGIARALRHCLAHAGELRGGLDREYIRRFEVRAAMAHTAGLLEEVRPGAAHRSPRGRRSAPDRG